MDAVAVAIFGVEEKVFSAFVSNLLAASFMRFAVFRNMFNFATVITLSSTDVKDIENIFIICRGGS